MLDDKGLRDIRIWEHADGLIVQGCRAGESTFESTLFTDEDLSDSWWNRTVADPRNRPNLRNWFSQKTSRGARAFAMRPVGAC